MTILQRALCMALASMPAVSFAALNDIFPTDHIALPDGKKNVALYGLKQEGIGPYKNGSKQLAGELDANLYALRVGKHFSFGENGQYTFGPLAVLSWGEGTTNTALKNVGIRDTSGYGDLRLGAAVWLEADRVNRRYTMFSASALLPTGTYDNTRVLNFGENRYRYVLAAGMMRSLDDRWVVDLMSEVAFYGDNPEYRTLQGLKRLSQDVSYAAGGILRYRLTPAFHLYGGAVFNAGGATQLNGNPNTGAPNNTRVNAGMMLLDAGKQQVQLRYGRDVSGDNGMRLDREIALRYSVFFD